jgi:peptide/nickel transport system ATP-binding protein
VIPTIAFENVSIEFAQQQQVKSAVRNISFSVPPKSITALIGESGSGKSVTSLAVLKLLPKTASISGQILFKEENEDVVDLTKTTETEMLKIRGKKIAFIFQEPMTSLNPMHTCGEQVQETLLLHEPHLSSNEAKKAVTELFKKCRLPEPEKLYNKYPHQISGGQKQRVMIAMAISCKPALLIADEPTTALDVSVQKSILELLKELQQEVNMSILFITHDLGLVNEIADHVVVMYKGEIVEKGAINEVFNTPKHNYTKALIACTPKPSNKGTRLLTVADFNDGNTVPQKVESDVSITGTQDLLRVEELCVHYATKTNWLGKTTSYYNAVNNVSFTLHKNETLGLVGESGCGKTTLGRALIQLVQPTSGKIYFNGEEILATNISALKKLRKQFQIVFQDPYGSLNPRLTVGNAIVEPMLIYFPELTSKQKQEKAINLLQQVGLAADSFNKYPHQFSGGQRQRICIARALAVEPSCIIFDESVSALDVSVQAQILNLINDLKQQYQFSAIFISHNLHVVHYICDRILVMQKGQIVEEGTAYQILFAPKHDYTKALLAAIPNSVE